MHIIKAHALMASFILPVALMFVITGALYTWGEKGSYAKKVHELTLETPLSADLAGLKKLARVELGKRSMDVPKGQAKLKIYGDHFLLEWTGSARDVILEPGDAPLSAKLTVKETTWYRSLVQLHKAKGGVVFKVYAVVFSLALLAILASGCMMAWQSPQLKRMSLVAALLGLLSFIAAVYLS
ncbi:MAG: PepSY domain-containing protein [Akkermansiaceae bacterium]|nr:PepSY domain-containing protein [Akkermansiaceae bacterium]